MTTTLARAISSQPQACGIAALNQAARQRLARRVAEPLFVCRWVDVVFVHYELEPAALRDLVPFELDLFRESAYVSTVAFTLRGMRLRIGGRVGFF